MSKEKKTDPYFEEEPDFGEPSEKASIDMPPPPPPPSYPGSEASVSLPDEEKKKKRRQMALIIGLPIIAVVVLTGIAAVLWFVFLNRCQATSAGWSCGCCDTCCPDATFCPSSCLSLNSPGQCDVSYETALNTPFRRGFALVKWLLYYLLS